MNIKEIALAATKRLSLSQSDLRDIFLNTQVNLYGRNRLQDPDYAGMDSDYVYATRYTGADATIKIGGKNKSLKQGSWLVSRARKPGGNIRIMTDASFTSKYFLVPKSRRSRYVIDRGRPPFDHIMPPHHMHPHGPHGHGPHGGRPPAPPAGNPPVVTTPPPTNNPPPVPPGDAVTV